MRKLLIVAAAAMVALPLLAQNNEISGYVGATHLGTTDTAGSSIKFDTGTTYGLSYNHYWTSRISTDFSAMQSSSDGELRVGGERALDLGSLDLTTFAAIAQFHIIRNTFLDFYGGVGVAYIQADDLTSSDLQTAGITNVHVGTETSGIANIGLAVGIKRFAVGVDGRYAHYRPGSASPGQPGVRLNLDPITVALALKFRF